MKEPMVLIGGKKDHFEVSSLTFERSCTKFTH